MGKHVAVDGESGDPIVATARASRPAEVGGAHAADGPRAADESPVGWPGPPAPEGGGLGWPADADGDTDATATDLVDGPAAPVARRSWRRLFGMGRVA